MQWVQGRFGLFGVFGPVGNEASGRPNETLSSNGTSVGRRLQSSGGGSSSGRPSKGGGVQSPDGARGTSAAKAADLRAAMMTSITDCLAFLGIFTLLHVILLWSWKSCTRQRKRRLPRASPETSEEQKSWWPSWMPALPGQDHAPQDHAPQRQQGGAEDQASWWPSWLPALPGQDQAARDPSRTPPPSPPASPQPPPAPHPCSLSQTKRRFSTKSMMRAMTKRPRPPAPKVMAYRPLPAVFVFPNLEVVLLAFFSSGIAEAAGAILGAVGEGGGLADELLALMAVAVPSLLFVIGFFVHEGVRLFRFSRRHRRSMWVDTKAPSDATEIDDPLLRGLIRCRLASRTMRFRGAFEAPDADVAEPERTERHVSRRHALSVWRHDTVGDEYESLATFWLADNTGSGCGVFYGYLKVLTTTLVSFLGGLSSAWGSFAIFLASGVQLAVGCYCLCSGHANDRLEGFVAGCELLIAAAIPALLAIGASLGDGVDAEMGNRTMSDISRTSGDNITDIIDVSSASDDGSASVYQSAALLCSLGSVLIPFCLALYDSILLPTLVALAERDRKGGLLAAVKSIVMVPVFVASSFFGDGFTNMASATTEVTEDVFDATLETATAEAVEAKKPSSKSYTNSSGSRSSSSGSCSSSSRGTTSESAESSAAQEEASWMVRMLDRNGDGVVDWRDVFASDRPAARPASLDTVGGAAAVAVAAQRFKANARRKREAPPVKVYV